MFLSTCILICLSSALAPDGNGAVRASAAAVADSLPTTPSSKVRRYAERLVTQYDADQDGVLQANEWRPMQGNPGQIDRDQDQRITTEEMALHIAVFAVGRSIAPAYDPGVQSPPSAQFSGRRPQNVESNQQRPPATATSSRSGDKPFYVPERFLPQALPEWFRTQDANGDGQLSLSEYAGAGEAAQAARFELLDRNRDGLVTPAELLSGPTDAPRETDAGARGPANGPSSGNATSAQ